MKTVTCFIVSFFFISNCFAQNKDNVSKDSCVISIPNALSVNSESRSDFGVRSNCDLKDLKLTIYDRWGNKIYETEKFDEDGYVDWKWKQLKDAGTYYWVVNYNKLIGNKEEKQSLTGFVTIIK